MTLTIAYNQTNQIISSHISVLVSVFEALEERQKEDHKVVNKQRLPRYGDT